MILDESEMFVHTL